MAALGSNLTTLGAPLSDAAAPRDTAAAAEIVAESTSSPTASPSSASAGLDPAVAALCTPISDADPCGPDLDMEGDTDYLNFFAMVDGVLPASYFDPNDGTPFDRTQVDIAGQLEAIKPLLKRTRDTRLLIMQGRLQILNRDLAGFAASLAAVAYWLDEFWEQVHPRPEGDDLNARSSAISALDPTPPSTPTVLFPLQYMPLFETRRLGIITYRSLMIANGEVKPRTGEQTLAASAIMEARGEVAPAALAAIRKHILTLKSALARISGSFAKRGVSAGLERLPALVERIHAFVDPEAAAKTPLAADGEAEPLAEAQDLSAPGPNSMAEASEALAAIAAYYSRREPSSPTLPLVRQAHQLIGKSFLEVISILVPTQMDNAAFQIGADQFFDLPINRLSKLSESDPAVPAPILSESAPAVEPPKPSEPAPAPESPMLPEMVSASETPRLLETAPAAEPPKADTPASNVSGATYIVQTRLQAVVLLERVQRFFRIAEPSSPVPLLCERARALAERDFMGVLRDVLPKAALRSAGADE
jgi:type VI secretion system protein ImpA